MKKEYQLKRWAFALLNLTISFFLLNVGTASQKVSGKEFAVEQEAVKSIAGLQAVPASAGEKTFTVNLLNPLLLYSLAFFISLFFLVRLFCGDRNKSTSETLSEKYIIWHFTTVLNAISVSFYFTFWLLVVAEIFFYRSGGILLGLNQIIFIAAEAAAVCWVVFAEKKRTRLLRGLGLWVKNIKSKIFSGVVFFLQMLPVFFVLVFASSFAVSWLRKVLAFEKDADMEAAVITSLLDKTFLLVLLAILTFTVVPVVEEFLFRGLLYGSLRKYLSPIFSALICGALFGLAHGSAEKFIPISFLGFVLCRIREKTASLYPAIAVHGIYNAYILLAIVSMFM